MKNKEQLRKAIDFHGHLCPGLAYGYRVAEAALRILGDRSVDEEIVAVVENDSCSVDAIQALMGCTFGKGNLIFRDHGKQAYTFFKRTTGEGVRICVDYQETESPEEKTLWEKFLSGDRSPEVAGGIAKLKERKTRNILNADDEKVLTIQEVKAPPPPRARIHPTVRCAKCGEKVMAPRVVERKGETLCIPCSGPAPRGTTGQTA